jgi:tetratricopeptide (TPR) repeat protein
MNSLRRPALLLSTAALLLGSCASTPPPAPEPPGPPPRDRVAELRSVASTTRSAVEVAPLQNPAVDLLLGEASELEAAGKHADAAARIEAALAIEPDNPKLLQLKAEALLRSELFLDAEKLAMKSYDLGSRIGEWCMRNWLTIAESRDALGDAYTSVAARERAQKCPVQPHQRF